DWASHLLRGITGVANDLPSLCVLHPQAKGLNWVDCVKGSHKYVIDEFFFAVFPGRKSKGVGEIIDLIDVICAHAAKMHRRIFGAKHKVSRRRGRIGMKPAPD